ncbi:MAG: hypothetical protein H6R18_417 [Proteobacteria bacterium]|nr:hypothetical protein [Pseudomonadota bacterium]
MQSNDLIQLLGNRLGIGNLNLDKNGLCRIKINQKIIIDFEEENNYLYMHSVIEDSVGKFNAAQLVALMRAHYLFNSVENASFGINDNDQLCLFSRIAVPGISEDVFFDIFESFVAAYIEWKNKIDSNALTSGAQFTSGMLLNEFEKSISNQMDNSSALPQGAPTDSYFGRFSGNL